MLTRPLLSAELETLTGAALGIIIVGGAMELPPDMELTEPMQSQRQNRLSRAESALSA